MNSEPTIEHMNEAIARFMGYEQQEQDFRRPNNTLVFLIDNHWTPIHHLKYHSSWEWLMPVVEKIESLHDDFHGYFGVHISSNSCTIQGTNLRTTPENFHPAYFNEVTHNTKIEATHLAIYQFIEWYNKQLK